MPRTYTRDAFASLLEKKGFRRDGPCYEREGVRIRLADAKQSPPDALHDPMSYYVGDYGDKLVLAGQGPSGRPVHAIVFKRGSDNPSPVASALRGIYGNPADHAMWERLLTGYDAGWHVAAELRNVLAPLNDEHGSLSDATQNAVLLVVAAGVLYHQGIAPARLALEDALASGRCSLESCIAALRNTLTCCERDSDDMLLCAPGGAFFEGTSFTWPAAILSVLGDYAAAGVEIDSYLLGTVFEQLQCMCRRKGAGVFYTPRTLAADTSMRCVQAHALFGGNRASPTQYTDYHAALETAPCPWRNAALDALAGVTILDPACGSGHFLEACLDAVTETVRQLGGIPPTPPALLPKAYGVDIDARAAWLARIRLALWAVIRNRGARDGPYASRSRIQCADSLLSPLQCTGSDSFSWQKFLADAGGAADIVIGNPPYGKVKNLPLSAEEKAAVARRYKAAFPAYRGNIDLYKLFVLRAMALAGEDAVISLVIPSTMWGDKDSHDIRRQVLSRGCFYIAFLGLGDSQLFFGSGMHYEVSVFAASRAARGIPICYIAPDGRAARHIACGTCHARIPAKDFFASSRLSRLPRYVDPGTEAEILRHLSSFNRLSSHISSRVGFIDETLGKDNLVSYPTGMMAISSTHIKDWHIDLGSRPTPKRWVEGWESLSVRPVQRPDGSFAPLGELVTSMEAVVGRQMAHRGESRKLHFACFSGGAVPTNGVRIVYATGDVPAKVLCAMLNSTCYNWLFSLFSHTYNVKPYELGELPAVIPGRSEAYALGALVDMAHRIAGRERQGSASLAAGQASAVSLLIDATIFEMWSAEATGRQLPDLFCRYLSDAGGDVLGRIISDCGVSARIAELYCHPWAGFCLPAPHNTFMRRR